jgi:hypothetical protein
MVKEILDLTGLPYEESHFLSPPSTTYAIYHDAINRRGGDNINLLSQHDVTIEIYERIPDPTAEIKLETTLDALGLEFEKQPRYWIQEEQIYQVVYDFTYYQKEDLKNGDNT